DGGVSRSDGIFLPNNYLSWEHLSGEGLNITQYWGVGIHDEDTNVFYGGAQDGTGSWTIDDGLTWTAGLWADGGDALVSRDNTGLEVMVINGKAWRHTSTKSYGTGGGKLGSKLAYHPNQPETIYA